MEHSGLSRMSPWGRDEPAGDGSACRRLHPASYGRSPEGFDCLRAAVRANASNPCLLSGRNQSR
jgi:hypothetical protein